MATKKRQRKSGDKESMSGELFSANNVVFDTTSMSPRQAARRSVLRHDNYINETRARILSETISSSAAFVASETIATPSGIGFVPVGEQQPTPVIGAGSSVPLQEFIHRSSSANDEHQCSSAKPCVRLQPEGGQLPFREFNLMDVVCTRTLSLSLVVTGANKVIGFETVRQLAASGDSFIDSQK